jgi:hypothetical protein
LEFGKEQDEKKDEQGVNSKFQSYEDEDGQVNVNGQRNKTIQPKSSDERHSSIKRNLIKKLCEQKGG